MFFFQEPLLTCSPSSFFKCRFGLRNRTSTSPAPNSFRVLVFANGRLRQGASHALKDAPATRALPVEQVFGSGSCDRARERRSAGRNRSIRRKRRRDDVVAGYFSTENGAQNLLFASLPPVLHVKGDAGTTVRWLEANLQFVAPATVLRISAGSPPLATILIEQQHSRKSVRPLAGID